MVRAKGETGRGQETDLMPRLWPDPRESEPESPIWLWLLLISLALIATAAIYAPIPS